MTARRQARSLTRVVDGVNVPAALLAGWDHVRWRDDAADLAVYEDVALDELQHAIVVQGGRIGRYKRAAEAFAREHGWVLGAEGKRVDWLRLAEVGIRRPSSRDRFDPRRLLAVD